jgi:hypothetical protein
LGDDVLNLLEFSQGVNKHVDIISLTFQKALTNFHTRGYLKIKMSHDEIVGNVLSWLGNWLRDRKQPKPTLLVTNSICSESKENGALLRMGWSYRGTLK